MADDRERPGTPPVRDLVPYPPPVPASGTGGQVAVPEPDVPAAVPDTLGEKILAGTRRSARPRWADDPGTAFRIWRRNILASVLYHLVLTFLPVDPNLRRLNYVWRLIRAFGRGVAVSVPATFRWLVAAKEAESVAVAKANGGGNLTKLQDQEKNARMWRCIGTGGGHVVAAMFLVNGGVRLDLAAAGYGAALLVVVLVVGIRTSPTVVLPEAAPRLRGEISQESINTALRAVGVLEKPTAKARRGEEPAPDGVTMAMIPRYVDGGTEAIFDLPASCGKEYKDVMAARGRFAAAFAVPQIQFHLERGDHEAQVRLWMADSDPFAGGWEPHPLLVNPSGVSIWDPAPFGRDARHRPVTCQLVFSSVLIGARPRVGKSFSMRVLLAAPLLDPTALLYLFNGKGDGTFADAEPLCTEYVRGARDGDCRRLAEFLAELVAEMDDRNDRMPGSKLTPEICEEYDMPIRVLLIDEVQRYLENPQYGTGIGRLLTDLARVGPSSGTVLILGTQKPDSEAFPSGLKSAMGTRYCLSVMSYNDTDIILGTGMSKLGYRAHEIPRKGLGWYRPDEDTDGDGLQDSLAKLIQCYDMDDPAWHALCELAAAARARHERTRPEAPVDAEVVDESPEPIPGDLLSNVAAVLYDTDQLPAVGLLARLPEPFASDLTTVTLGRQLSGLGVKSRATPDKRRGYYYTDAAAVLAARDRGEHVTNGSVGSSVGRSVGHLSVVPDRSAARRMRDGSPTDQHTG